MDIARYSNIERLGVIKSNEVITRDLLWIFREQTVADVGIDAIIEQVEEGNPTGKFIAVQIKSGQGNFYITEKNLTYYVSNIHYNYWLSLNIPLIMIAYLPETELIFWEEIGERTMKRTKTKWKIDIPKSNNLGIQSKERLQELLKTKSQNSLIFELYKGCSKPDSFYDVVERVGCISESVSSLNNISQIISEMSLKMEEHNNKLRRLIELDFSDKDEEVQAVFKGIGRSLNITSKRLENEIELFSTTFLEGFYAYQQVLLLNFKLNQDTKVFKESKSSIEDLSYAMNLAIDGVETMRSGVKRLPTKYKTLKEARQKLIDTIDYLIFEFNQGLKVTINKEVKK